MSTSPYSVRTRSFAALLLVLGVGSAVRSLSAETLAVLGPPWISIETPVNPYDASTRGAFLIVHAFHHGTPVAVPVSGTAEGIVNGQRRSVALQFTPTSRPGAYALRKQWGDAGIWTLVITVSQHADDVAQALVEIGPNGDVTRVQVPTRVGERADMPFPRRVTAAEVDAALRQRQTRAVAGIK